MSNNNAEGTKKPKTTLAEKMQKKAGQRVRICESIVQTIEQKVGTAFHYGMTKEQAILERCIAELKAVGQ